MQPARINDNRFVQSLNGRSGVEEPVGEYLNLCPKGGMMTLDITISDKSGIKIRSRTSGSDRT